MSTPTTLLPFQPATMSTAQLVAVSFLARHFARTHHLHSFQLREWFAWCERNGLDPLVGVQRAHVELFIRSLGERGLMDSSVVSMMNGVRGFFRLAHIDGLIPADPAVYARLQKVQRDESRTQSRDQLELIRFLQVAQTVTVHHGALAYLTGIHALCAFEAAAVRIENYAKSATRSTGATPTGWSPRSPRRPASPGTSARTHCGTRPSPTPWMPAFPFATRRFSPATPTQEPPSTTTGRAATSTAKAVHFLTAYVAGV